VDMAMVQLGDPQGRVTVLDAMAVAPGKYRLVLPVRQTGHHRLSVQVGNVSKHHDFYYEAPAELDTLAFSKRTLDEWLEKDLVQAWTAGKPMQLPVTVITRPSRSVFVVLAALLYFSLLIMGRAYVFRTWWDKLSRLVRKA
jgi:hypothetical protein